ncbi:hypothetical protein G6F36_013576 [Rhizopus arrhizus]|nr:hypothetical protein G6F36_013576 [Rhizopus arrhizus]
MIGDGILDPGSHGSIISKKLVDDLQLTIVKKSNLPGNKLADGSVIRPLGIIKNLLVSVQGVMIRITPVVFEKAPYDLLLGSESLQVLGIAVDYSRAHFTINTDNGIEPLTVRFLTDVELMRPMEGAGIQSDWEEGYSGDEDELSTSEESDETYETEDCEADGSSDYVQESYLIFPIFEEEEEKEEDSPNEVFFNGLGSETKLIKNESTRPEEIKTILKEQVQELEISYEEKEQLEELLYKFLDVFGLDYNDLKQTNLVKFSVDTGDHAPIMKRPNKHMSHSELEVFKQELSNMLANGQIIPTMHRPKKDGSSSLGWSFPAMYVRKKNTKEGRLVVQFQDLNAITKKDPWPLPSLQHLLEDYLGSEVFTTFDLLKGV